MQSFDKKIIAILVSLCFLLGLLWKWAQSYQLKDFVAETVFYLGVEAEEMGRLIAFDPLQNEKFFLTDDHEIINQFVLYGRKDQKNIFYLSVPKDRFLDSVSVQQNQTLYKIDLLTGKKRRIAEPKKAELSKMHPKVVNDKLFFESSQGLWYYSLRQNTWGMLYENIPLQDVAFSEYSQLLVGANPFENFGFTLFSLTEGRIEPKPIGNYFQNFGFSPDGKQILLKQKPDQDIFSDQSYLIVFSADGTAREILQDRGDITQALWLNNERIVVVLRDEAFIERIFLVDLNDAANPVEISHNKSVEWVGYKNHVLWIVTESESDELVYNEQEDIKDLLAAFGDLEKKYTIWSYDFVTQDFFLWPIEGFFPQTF